MNVQPSLCTCHGGSALPICPQPARTAHNQTPPPREWPRGSNTVQVVKLPASPVSQPTSRVRHHALRVARWCRDGPPSSANAAAPALPPTHPDRPSRMVPLRPQSRARLLNRPPHPPTSVDVVGLREFVHARKRWKEGGGEGDGIGAMMARYGHEKGVRFWRKNAKWQKNGRIVL